MNSPSIHPSATERPPRLEMVEWLIDRRSKSVKLAPPKSSNKDASLTQSVSSAYQEPYIHEKLPYGLHSPYPESQLANQTETKILGKYVSYTPKNYSAAMLNNNDNYYRALNMSFDLLEQPAGSSNAKSHLGLASNPTLMSAIKSELEHALDRFGFHEISGARYAAFSVYKGRANDKWHFVSSSNTDPLVKDFNKLEYRRCAEDTASIVAHLNGLDKLKYLFLYRAPYPEAYAKKEDKPGIFPFFKLVPCKTCSKHLKKILEDNGSLIIVTTAEQGKKLEASLRKGVAGAVDSKYLILKDQKASDFSITYSRKNKEGDCFIEIAAENLARLLVEKQTGANVQARSKSQSEARSLICLGEWLNSESLESRMGDLSTFLDKVIRSPNKV